MGSLMTMRLDSIAKIKDYHGPLLLSHGDADEVVPYEQGLALYNAAPGPKRMITVPGGKHNQEQPASIAWPSTSSSGVCRRCQRVEADISVSVERYSVGQVSNLSQRLLDRLKTCPTICVHEIIPRPERLLDVL
jgi:fermentation-respiration switch protein FrsA (DUF1100 family)